MLESKLLPLVVSSGDNIGVLASINQKLSGQIDEVR
jgi:hypothetical protein